MMDENFLGRLETRARLSDARALAKAKEKIAEISTQQNVPKSEKVIRDWLISELESTNELLVAAQESVADLEKCRDALKVAEGEIAKQKSTIQDLESKLSQALASNADVESARRGADESSVKIAECNVQIDSLRTQLQDEKVTCAGLSARLESERDERARADKILEAMLQHIKDMRPVEEPGEEHESTPKWEFVVKRDGANRMTGLTAVKAAE